VTVLDLSAADYHADPAEQPSLSASIANLLLTSSPKHAWTAHPRLNPDFKRTEDGKFDIGTVAHALLLNQHVDCLIVEADDWRTKAAQQAREQARSIGAIPILRKHHDAVLAMRLATTEQLANVDVAPPLFTDGKPEQTLIWQEDGVTCRARLDWLRDDHTAIDDYKTTSASAHPERWTRTLYTIGADVQVAFYLRGARAALGSEPAFRYVVQETSPPYALSVVSLSPAALELAQAKVDHALAVWKRCLADDDWPAYPERVCFAELPPWEEARWLEREAREYAA
jgi:hypothetical protein